MLSRSAFRKWGEREPASFTVCTRDELVAADRDRWLRDAECVIRTLDHKAFKGGSFHVIDGRDIGMPESGYMGLAVGAQLHELARDHLPRSAHNPIAAVAVNIEAVARNTIGIVCESRENAHRRVRAAVAAVAAHEYAHHVVALVDGRVLPQTATIGGTVERLRTSGHDRAVNDRSHGAPWARAYAHLVKRASFLPHHDEWIKRFRADLKAATAVDADAVLDALHSDFARFTTDDALADVIRTAAPAAFLALFDERGAARSATETVTHGSAS